MAEKGTTLCPGCFDPRPSGVSCKRCGPGADKPANAMVLPPSSRLARRYATGMLLGQGGFGATYAAWDSRLTVKVAVKEFFPRDVAHRLADGALGTGEADVALFQKGVGRFLDEARLLARLRANPNIVSVFDFFEENGTAYIVMEFLEGRTLRTVQRSHGDERMPFDDIRPIAEEIFAALAFIHSDGILHRDVAPDNIILTDSGFVKLIDFGAAREALIGEAESHSIIVKPGYAPIEQYCQNDPSGPWTDIYALGATLYFLLTGQKPPDSLRRLNRDELVAPTELGVRLPRKAEAALMTALALRAADRFRTIDAFREMFLAVSSSDRALSTRSLAAAPSTVGGGVAVLGGGSSDMVMRTLVAEVPAVTQAATEGAPGPGTRPGGAAAGMGEMSGQYVTVPLDRFAEMVARHRAWRTGKRNGQRLVLSMANLSGAALTGKDLSQAELAGCLFVSANLTGVDFSSANLFCADFRYADLRGADFRKADLRGARFDSANLADARFDGCDCREGSLYLHNPGGLFVDVKKATESFAASFVAANVNNASFRDAALNRVDFSRATLDQAAFQGTDLTDATFAAARVTNAGFEGASMVGATFFEADLGGVDTHDAAFSGARLFRKLEELQVSLQDQIKAHARWAETLAREGARLELAGADLSGLVMNGVDWSAAEFRSVNLSGASLNGAKLSMATFWKCDLTGADLSKLDGRGINFISCALDGARLSGSDFRSVASIRDPAVRWPSCFTGSSLRRTDLIDCRCRGAVFTKADLTEARIAGADFTEASFDDAVSPPPAEMGSAGVSATGGGPAPARALARQMKSA